MNKEYQIGFSDEFTYGDTLIKYEISEDKILHLYVEDVARALGVTETKVLKDGSSSETIQWKKVYRDLVAIGVIDRNIFKWTSNNDKKISRKHLKKLKLTKEEIISWGHIVKTPNANDFLQVLSNVNCKNIVDITTNINRKETVFLDELEEVLKSFDILGVRQYRVFNYRIDYYIPSLNIAIEYDENEHKYYSYERHEGRQIEIEKELGCRFIRISDKNTNGYNIGYVIRTIIELRYSLLTNVIKEYNKVKNKKDTGDFLENRVELSVDVSNTSFCFKKDLEYIEEEDYIESYFSDEFKIEDLIKDIVKDDMSVCKM